MTCWPVSHGAVAWTLGVTAGTPDGTALYVTLSIAAAPRACVAGGTIVSVDSFTSAPLIERSATFDPSTALFVIFARVTAAWRSCVAPTLFFGRVAAA